MYIADLHIHSRFSRATSKEGDAPHLDLWAGRKGIGLVGTGDFTHPAWRAELQEMLTPAEEGFYTLKPQYRLPSDTAGAAHPPRFVLTGEISSIYKKNGRVRKVHNLILLPSFQAAEELSRRLERCGQHPLRRPAHPRPGQPGPAGAHPHRLPGSHLHPRPYLDAPLLPVRGLLRLPDHGGVLRGHDPPHPRRRDRPLLRPAMNWQVSALDRYTLVSNSDAHSPQKLGREANLLDCGLSYPALKHAIETGEGFGGTIEFFPEEGKYHLDGHRNCGVCLTPQEAESLGGLCPVCGKKLTIGGAAPGGGAGGPPPGPAPPQSETLREPGPPAGGHRRLHRQLRASKKTQARYQAMLQQLGSEFHILRQAGFEDIQRVAGPAVAEGIRRLRAGPGWSGSPAMMGPSATWCSSPRRSGRPWRGRPPSSRRRRPRPPKNRDSPPAPQAGQPQKRSRPRPSPPPS